MENRAQAKTLLSLGDVAPHLNAPGGVIRELVEGFRNRMVLHEQVLAVYDELARMTPKQS